ncbi:MAG: AbrB/MazE/SpoVT family DNA-binding domain-containing protein [Chloroflexi bacterium]|nr:AbrB/MazE/SpoVT family DNA-binding domain-containing protein [Chloroflexota bacterium]
MKTNLAKIDQTGRVLIPAEYRKAMGVKAGDQVIVVLEGNSVRVLTVEQAVKEARLLLRLPQRGRSLTDELIKERRKEAASE